MVLVGGYAGNGSLKTVEIIGEDHEPCPISNLPHGISRGPLLFATEDQDILLCGGIEEGSEKHCKILSSNSTWENFKNDLLFPRQDSLSITTEKGVTYIFGSHLKGGGWTTSEYFSSAGQEWLYGPKIPGKGIRDGCGVTISENEILLIGGDDSLTRIIKLDLNTGNWTNPSISLKYGRWGHKCTVFKNKVVITGGMASNYYVTSTEIIDLENKDNLTIRVANGEKPLDVRRNHGMGVATIDNVPTLIAFGGYNGTTKEENKDPRFYLDSVFMWNDTSEDWIESTKFKMTEGKRNFGTATLPTKLICPSNNE